METTPCRRWRSDPSNHKVALLVLNDVQPRWYVIGKWTLALPVKGVVIWYVLWKLNICTHWQSSPEPSNWLRSLFTQNSHHPASLIPYWFITEFESNAIKARCSITGQQSWSCRQRRAFSSPWETRSHCKDPWGRWGVTESCFLTFKPRFWDT